MHSSSLLVFYVDWVQHNFKNKFCPLFLKMIGINIVVTLHFLSKNNHRSLDLKVQGTKFCFPNPVAPQRHEEFHILAVLSCKLEPVAQVSSADPREPTNLAQRLHARTAPCPGEAREELHAHRFCCSALGRKQACGLASGTDQEELGRLLHTAAV